MRRRRRREIAPQVLDVIYRPPLAPPHRTGPVLGREGPRGEHIVQALEDPRHGPQDVLRERLPACVVPGRVGSGRRVAEEGIPHLFAPRTFEAGTIQEGLDDGDVVESTEEAALDEFIRQETELTAYSIKANAGSIHSPSHPCWAELRALRQGATQSSEASSLTHGGRGALNGRLRPQKKEQDPEEAALAKLRSRAAQSPPSKPKPFLASPSPTTKSGFRVLAPPGKPLTPASPSVEVASPVASPVRAAATPVAAPVARRASPVKPKLDPNVVLRPAIASRASPRTDLVRELLGSPQVHRADAPLTSAQKTTLKRRTRPKKKLHHAVSTFELAKRSAAKSAFADPATREVT